MGWDLSWVNSRVQTELESISYNPQHNEHSENPVGGIARVMSLKGIQGHHCSGHVYESIWWEHCSGQRCAEHPVTALHVLDLCRTSSDSIAGIRAVQNTQWQPCRYWTIEFHPVKVDSITGAGPLKSTNALLR